MSIVEELLTDLPQGEIIDVCIGLHWTAVVVAVEGEQRCGLASTLADSHPHGGEPTFPAAGAFAGLPASELAACLRSENPVRASVGLAAVNALLPRHPQTWIDLNAEEVIRNRGAGKKVVLVGHFPFVPRLRQQLDNFVVLEQSPLPGDLPASRAAQVLPEANLVAITGMSLHNGTLENLLSLCSPEAEVLVLGPSTPLSPVLFRRGVDLIAGAIVEQIEPVLRTIRQGGNFRQVHRAGVRLVTVTRSPSH